MDSVLSFFRAQVNSNHILCVFCGVVMWAVRVMGAQLFRCPAVLVFQALSVSLTSVPVAISQGRADIKDCSSVPTPSELPAYVPF